MKIDEKDIQIIAALRRDCRQKLTALAQTTNIPLSTLHERLTKLQDTKTIRLISIPCYRQLRLPLHCWAAIRTQYKEQALTALQEAPFVNTILGVNNGADWLVECVFPGFSEQHQFALQLKHYGNIEFYPVLDVLQKEELLTK